VLKNCLLLIAFVATISSCNNTNNKPTIKKRLSDYNFSIPKEWQVERMTFPIDFAPDISYSGVEDLRFTPGWEFTTSEEHWSYIFLWWVDGNPNINDTILQKNLKIYYIGLVTRNITKRYIPANKIIPTVTTIRKIETTQNDTDTYK
jgi:hypothetical protein